MITEKIILHDTKYGEVHCNLKQVMKKRNISMYKLIRLSGLKYEVISKYYYDNAYRYDADVIAKFCYILDCKLSDIIKYIPNV